ncbi:MAG TPA: prepilin peptidase [Archangium sp.]|uniref:prepilin peptidase n=1 Tax=Archangium sp. TaxID=1872627 RepID=UPI002E371951|nr:prepilin peptidase [Archangium sp.]HEX5748702.1 prepilin peptidase [Archangium sp.]
MGLLFGSFLNVVIARVPAGESIVHPRSRCPRCGHQLAWYENIPVLSWLALRARCSSCGLPISWRYPLIELLTALLFLACQRRFGWTPELVAALVLVLLLVPLSFIDLEHWILPHELTWPGIAAGVVLSWPMGWGRVQDAIIGAVVGFLVFWGMEWLGEKIFKKEALGAGDKDLLALIGAFLTWKPLLAVIFLSSLQGAVVGSLLLLVRGRAGPAPDPEPGPESTPAPPVGPEPVDTGGEEKKAEDEEEEEDDWEPGPTSIPFGPWLSLAALEVMLLGPLLREVLPVPLDMLFAGAR